jgi:hypothetical protein
MPFARVVRDASYSGFFLRSGLDRPPNRSVTKPDVLPPLTAMTTREHDPVL